MPRQDFSVASDVTLNPSPVREAAPSVEQDMDVRNPGLRGFPFDNGPASMRPLNENIARIEALKIKVLEWPGLSSAVRNTFFAELDALRAAFVQLANDAFRTVPQKDCRPAAEPHKAPEHLKIEGIIGQSKRIADILKIVARVSPTDLTVLFEGETGSGKELFARIIHNNSQREQFIAVNCGAFPTGIIESELFGHVKGAFTGATSDRKGTFEEANGGTIFLDEIGELELLAQVKLLRVLEVGELQRVGSDKTIHTDVRVIAATNRDLQAMVKQKTFREDLYYRLNMCPIFIPPLRERRDEIRILLDYFFQEIRAPERKPPVLSKQLRDFVYYQYDFPGNIRELKNLAQYIAMVDAGRPVSLRDLPQHYQNGARVAAHDSENAAADTPLEAAREQAEKKRLMEAVQRCRGNIKKTCAELRLSRARVYQLFHKHTIEPGQYR